MNSRQLQIFCKVADCGSMSIAAGQLFLAQSAVSTAIQKLEESLGTKLFERRERRIFLTEDGRLIHVRGRRILAEMEDAKTELAERRALQRGHVVIGIPAMLASYHFPKLFTSFCRRYPGITVSVADEGTETIRDRLRAGSLDLGIVNLERSHHELATDYRIVEEVLACVGAGHAWAGRRNLPLAAFAAEPLVLYRKGYYLREVIEVLGAEQNVPLNVAYETNLFPLMRTLISGGHAVGVCLRCLAAAEPLVAGVSFKPRIPLNLALGWRKRGTLPAAARAFIEHCVADGVQIGAMRP